MSTTHAEGHRRAELARIHILAGQLGMDTSDKNPESEYRSTIYAVTRCASRSTADLDYQGWKALIDHLQALARSRGIDTGMPKAKRRSFPGRPHNCDQHPQLLKIEALLTDARRPWSYVDAMADRMCGKARVAFCTPQDWQKLIVALELDKRRRSAKAT